jgi:3-hydroxybutyryl-CoA dehydrogenase
MTLSSQIKTIAVIGAGQMGSGIAQVAAQAGFQIILFDKQEEIISKATLEIEKSLTKLFNKGKIDEHPPVILGRIKKMNQLIDLTSADFVIEAIHENESSKKEIFSHLDKIMPLHVIFASNTSSLPITRLASSTGRPAQFIGMHFMNPVPLMGLIEIIKGHATSHETCEVTKLISEKMGKVTVSSQDYPGFIVNRILMPMINEAFYALMEGISNAEDIDIGMKLGTNQPMGPLTLADFIGLDTCYAIMKVLHEGLGDSKYRPCPLLKKYVDAGHFGKKSGQGVYKYKN